MALHYADNTMQYTIQLIINEYQLMNAGKLSAPVASLVYLGILASQLANTG
jgi:hypothetical protein